MPSNHKVKTNVSTISSNCAQPLNPAMHCIAMQKYLMARCTHRVKVKVRIVPVKVKAKVKAKLLKVKVEVKFQFKVKIELKVKVKL